MFLQQTTGGVSLNSQNMNKIQHVLLKHGDVCTVPYITPNSHFRRANCFSCMDVTVQSSTNTPSRTCMFPAAKSPNNSSQKNIIIARKVAMNTTYRLSRARVAQGGQYTRPMGKWWCQSMAGNLNSLTYDVCINTRGLSIMAHRLLFPGSSTNHLHGPEVK